jgi:hypothetical protein
MSQQYTEALLCVILTLHVLDVTQEVSELIRANDTSGDNLIGGPLIARLLSDCCYRRHARRSTSDYVLNRTISLTPDFPEFIAMMAVKMTMSGATLDPFDL